MGHSHLDLVVDRAQKKAENFYTSANVKNKNRGKAALMKSLVGKKGAQEAAAAGAGAGRRRKR